MTPALAKPSWRRTRLCASSRCALSAARLALAPDTPARWVSTAASAASTFASESARLARACSRLARCEATCASYTLGSSWATNCPFFTTVLKSAYNSEIVPETWLPTCTVVTACSVPVAETVLRMAPRSAFVVMYSSDDARRPHRKYPPVPPTRATPIAVTMSCFLLNFSFIFLFPQKSTTGLKTPRRAIWLRFSEIKGRQSHYDHYDQ